VFSSSECFYISLRRFVVLFLERSIALLFPFLNFEVAISSTFFAKGIFPLDMLVPGDLYPLGAY